MRPMGEKMNTASCETPMLEEIVNARRSIHPTRPAVMIMIVSRLGEGRVTSNDNDDVRDMNKEIKAA